MIFRKRQLTDLKIIVILHAQIFVDLMFCLRKSSGHAYRDPKQFRVKKRNGK